LVSTWVGGYQGEVLPEGVFFLLSGRVCVDSETWGCDLVLCMCVTGLGVLCAFLMCVLVELGLLLSVDGENHDLNLVCVVVSDAQI